MKDNKFDKCGRTEWIIHRLIRIKLQLNYISILVSHRISYVYRKPLVYYSKLNASSKVG